MKRFASVLLALAMLLPSAPVLAISRQTALPTQLHSTIKPSTFVGSTEKLPTEMEALESAGFYKDTSSVHKPSEELPSPCAGIACCAASVSQLKLDKQNGTMTSTNSNSHDSYDDAVAYLRAQMVEREGNIVLRINGTHYTSADAVSLYSSAISHTGNPKEGDYLRWNQSGYTYSITTGEDESGIYTMFSYSFNWFTTAEQEAEVDEAIAQVLAELDLWDATEYEKILGAYDYVCKNVVYDHDNLYDDTYYLKHSTYAALIHKKAVCQGFSTLFYRLCLELGVDARVIVGYTDERHAWNIVRAK